MAHAVHIYLASNTIDGTQIDVAHKKVFTIGNEHPIPMGQHQYTNADKIGESSKLKIIKNMNSQK